MNRANQYWENAINTILSSLLIMTIWNAKSVLLRTPWRHYLACVWYTIVAIFDASGWLKHTPNPPPRIGSVGIDRQQVWEITHGLPVFSFKLQCSAAENDTWKNLMCCRSPSMPTKFNAPTRFQPTIRLIKWEIRFSSLACPGIERIPPLPSGAQPRGDNCEMN